jgi:hypothetical protein
MQTILDAGNVVDVVFRTVASSVVRSAAAALCVDEQAAYGRSELCPARLHVVPDHVESTR